MRVDTPQEQEALDTIRAAIQAYTDELVKRKDQDDGPAFLASWVCYFEYLTPSDMKTNTSTGMWIGPPDQLPSTCRGLFQFGVDRLTQVQTYR